MTIAIIRAIKAPQILELSGIGDNRILESLGIETVVDLPGVGANAQEHVWTSLVYGDYYTLQIKRLSICSKWSELNPGSMDTLDALEDKAYAARHLALQYVLLYPSSNFTHR